MKNVNLLDFALELRAIRKRKNDGLSWANQLDGFIERFELTVTTGRATGIAHETVQPVTAGETAQCLGCDSLSCRQCFERHADELGYIKPNP